MDFTKYDSRKAAEVPMPLQLVHPATGEPLTDNGKPCIVLLIGSESATAQAAFQAQRRAKAKGVTKDPETQDDVHRAMVARALPLIVGFENVERGDRPATIDDAEWFLNLQLVNGVDGEKSFVEQVLAHAASRESVLGNGSAA